MQPRKVLIITYYWPPAGGPGVQRWLKFAKYLPKNNWEPIIYTPENPSYPTLDESLIAEIPKGIKVLKTKIWEPYRLAEKLNPKNKKFKSGQFDIGEKQSFLSKLSIFIRGNFFIPDARKFWIKPSVSYLTKYLNENPVEAVITTGPPHSMHLIGREIKKRFPQIKWIADFRDPWTDISYYRHLKLSPKADQKHHQLENSVMKTADAVLATSYSDTENFQKLGARATTITNGFDNAVKPANKEVNTKFTLAYIGILEQLRNPKPLWQALKELLDEQPDFVQYFELKFIGKIDEAILQELEDSILKNILCYKGYLSHEAAQTEMMKADLLLLTNFPHSESKGIIPGKLFEYLASGNPILSLGPPQADVAKILEETQSGQHFTYKDKNEIKNYVKQVYNTWKNGSTRFSPKNIVQFSRENLTRQLAALLDRLTED